MKAPYRYQSPDEDSGRWSGFAFRPGDIVISTRSKHGTTWMQMICALLVLGARRVAALAPPDLLSWLHDSGAGESQGRVRTARASRARAASWSSGG